MKDKYYLLIIIFASLTFIIGFLSFQRKVESWTPLGFYMEDKERGPTIVQVEAGSVAEEIGLRTKDVLIEVNGIKGNSSFLKKIILSNKKGSKILILRDKKILTFNYKPPEEKIDTDYLIFSFIGSVFFIIGLITYFKEPNNLNFIFALIMIFSFTLLSVVPSGKLNDLWRVLYGFKTLVSFLFFPLLIHFFLYFPRLIFLKKIKFFWTLYIPGLLLFLLFVDGLLLGGKFIIKEEKVAYIFQLKFIYYFVYSLSLLCLIIFQWARPKKPYQWKRWLWAISGIFGLLPYLFFEVIYKDLGFDSGIPLWALSLFLVLLPLSFSTALSGWKLENLPTYFLNTLYFLLTLFFGLFLYIFLNAFLLKLFQDKLKASQNFILFLSGFLIALILYLSRKKIFFLSDKFFGTKRTEIQDKISLFAQEMAFYKNPDKLLLDLFALLKTLFALNYVNFYYYKEGKWKIFLKDEQLQEEFEGEELPLLSYKFKTLSLSIKNTKLGALILGEKEGEIPLTQWE
ncbi:MAG: PDZ domain-containing protein, partial [Thermoanaerobaculia bacterium]